MQVNDIKWIEEVQFNADGLIPAIAIDHVSGRVLMGAWMNHESLTQTITSEQATYWSRSRAKLWVKGELSGHTQLVKSVQLDCDGDMLVLEVEQIGGIACHTGRQSCFFRTLTESGWQVTEPVLKDPKEIYSDG